MFSRLFLRSRRRCPSAGFNHSSPTKQGLSYTPAELMDLSRKGIPVTAVSSESYFDGEANPSFDLPVDMCRGVDIVDCWVAQSDSRSKLSRAHLTDTKKYG